MNLRAYLVTLPTDGRAQVEMELPRRTPELCGEEMEPPFQDPGHGSPPPRVQESDCPLLRVHQEYGHAICHRYAQEGPRRGGEVAVRIRAEPEAGCPGVQETRGFPHLMGGVATVESYGPFMDLPGVGDPGKTQGLSQTLPGLGSPRSWRGGKQTEIPRLFPPGCRPPRNPLDKPRELDFPFGVGPVGGISGSDDLGDPAGVNPRGSWAYHSNELPDIPPIDPGNLSYRPKFRSFQVHPPKGSPRHQ